MEGDDGKRRGNGQGASAKTPMRRMRASGDRIGTAQQTPGGENTCGNGEAPGDLRWDIILIRQDADLAPAASRRPASRRLLSRSLLSTLHIIPATHGPPSLTARSSRCPSPNGAPPSAMFLQPPVAALHTAPSASFMNKDDQPSHLYLHQQRTVEVIQLIEVPPPPPRSHPYTSTIASSSFASSSCYSSDDDSEDELSDFLHEIFASTSTTSPSPARTSPAACCRPVAHCRTHDWRGSSSWPSTPSAESTPTPRSTTSTRPSPTPAPSWTSRPGSATRSSTSSTRRRTTR